MRPILFLCVLALSRPIFAQVNGGTANRTIPAPEAPTAQRPAGEGFLRLFEVVSPATKRPLTQKERFLNYLISTVGPVPIFMEAAVAGYDQGLDRPHEWRLGATGYGKRFANDAAYSGVRQTLTYGMSDLLHEDVRYYRSDQPGFGPRLEHALTSTLIARRNGHEVFSVSAATGVVGASLISRTWVPPSWRHAQNVGASIGLTLAGMAGFNVVREFLPDLLRRK